MFILFTASAFRKLRSIYVFSYFPFGFEGRIWDLIVSVPDHCLSFYFATPTDNPDFDSLYKNQVEFDTLLIESIADQQTYSFKSDAPKEIQNIVHSFKMNKAQDIFGLSSEHLKFAPHCLYCIISSLMNCILHTGYVPYSSSRVF